MFLDNMANKLKAALVRAFKRITRPKTVADNIWGSLLALSIVFCVLYYIEKLRELF